MYISKGYKGVYDLYYTNPATGKTTKVSTGKKTKTEAIQFQCQFILSKSNDKPIVKRELLFSDLSKEIIEFAASNYCLKTTIIYQGVIKNVLRVLGNRNINSYYLKDFENYKNIRLTEIGKTSVNMEVRTIKAMFNYALRMGYIKDNPLHYVKQFTIPQKDILCFNDFELNQVFANIDDEYFRHLITFALLTGCRLNEILNIQLADIDYEEMILTIRNKPDFKIKTGKIRYIPITERLEQLLKSITTIDNNIIEINTKERYLFTNHKCNKLLSNCVSKRFKRYLRKSDLPERFHFHCLRHTFITNLIKNGVSINYVKQLAGHSDIKTTMGYIHIETEDLREAMNTLKLVS